MEPPASRSLDLTDQLLQRELVRAASAVRKLAYAPYSRFAVGAAVRSSDGRIYAGCNVENSTYGLTMCAERVALFAALANGDRVLVELALVADHPQPIAPCGACRQVLKELAPDARVVMANLAGEVCLATVTELLPTPFALGQRK